MQQYQCRRKLKVDVGDITSKDVYKNVIVADAERQEKLFLQCVTCGYGVNGIAFDGKKREEKARAVKLCTLRKVK